MRKIKKKIIALGGGELKEKETLEMDKIIVNATEKKNPKALFIPTASKDSVAYCDIFRQVYESIGAKTKTLLLIEKSATFEESKKKIASADLIYVGGGDTAFMLSVWKDKGLFPLLQEAYEEGTVLSGLSAGSICWFAYGHSDTNEREDNKFFVCKTSTEKYAWIKGMGFLPYAHAPHYNERKELLADMERGKSKIANKLIALDDGCGIFFEEDRYKIIKSDVNAKAYMIEALPSHFHKRTLENTYFMPMATL